MIKDKSLIRFGMKNEIIGILLATTVGFLFGMIICFVDKKYEYGSDSEAALTSEMIGRHGCLVIHAIIFCSEISIYF